MYSRPVIDEVCERIVTDLLRDRHGTVRYPVSTDDLTVLLERDTEDLDLFADLAIDGEDVEGLTMFRPGRKPVVRISDKLTNDPYRTNRLRSTLAHEYAHVLLHGFLWEDGPAKPRLDTAAERVDWMEWQANYAAGALLIPLSALARTAARHRREPSGAAPLSAASPAVRSMITAVSRGFGVSRAAARVRLEQTGHLAGDGKRRS